MMGENYETLLKYLTAVSKNQEIKSDDFYPLLEDIIKNNWSTLKEKEHSELSDIFDNLIDISTFEEKNIVKNA